MNATAANTPPARRSPGAVRAASVPDTVNSTLPHLGDLSLLSLPGATAFLSSRRGSAKAALACLEWAEGRRNDARPVIGGFHSDLEKDVLKLLLRGTCPIVLVLARTLWKEIPEELSRPISSGRLLVVSAAPTTSRVSAATALLRNRFVLDHAAEIVVGTLEPGGALATLLRACPGKPLSVFHELPCLQRKN